MNSVKQKNKDFSSDIKQPIQKSYAFVKCIYFYCYWCYLVLLGLLVKKWNPQQVIMIKLKMLIFSRY